MRPEIRDQRARRGSPALLALLGLIFLAPAAGAQQMQASNLPAPRLHTLFPAGAKAGTSVEVTFTGTDLDEPEKLLFSHPGLKAEAIYNPVPPPDPKKPMPAQKPTVARFKVTVAANVPIGAHDARLVGKYGVTNARAFIVGDLSEINEIEPNSDIQQAQKISLETTVNGFLASPTDVDYFCFAGKKGQRVVLACLGSEIDSRINPLIEVFDADDQKLGENRNYRDRDALLDVTLPADGDYYIRLSEFTHTAGNQEHFYRLTVTTGPWIDAIYPPMVEPGKTSSVTVLGRNLPGGTRNAAVGSDGTALDRLSVNVTAPGDAASLVRLKFSGRIAPLASGLDGFEYRLRAPVGTSNPWLLTYARAPVILDNENNDTPESAQAVTLPAEIAGRIEKRRDRDWYVFQAKRGEVWQFELYGERLDSPTDFYFTIRSGDNKSEITTQDDSTETLGFKFYARTFDPPSYRFTAPADGKYLILVGSRTASVLYGPRHLYRLRISQPKPDFRLVTVGPDNYRPDALNLRQGCNDSLSVFVWRQDGFAGDVTLSVEGLPAGVTCPPQTLGAGVRYAKLVFTVAENAAPDVREITVKGTASINGKAVTHEARPGAITWPVQLNQPVPVLARLERSLWLAIRDKAPYQLTASVDKPVVVQGDRLAVKLNLKRQSPDFTSALTVGLLPSNQNNAGVLPQGVQVQPAQIPAGRNEGTLNLTIGTNVTPGTYNLVLASTGQMQLARNPANPRQRQNTPVSFPSNALTITILPRALASNVQLSTGSPTVKLGQQTEVTLRLTRLFEFDGEYRVQVVLPANVKGLTIADAVIPPGQNEARLVIKTTADARVGNIPNLTVKTTALFQGKTPIVQETRLNVNIVK